MFEIHVVSTQEILSATVSDVIVRFILCYWANILTCVNLGYLICWME